MESFFFKMDGVLSLSYSLSLLFFASNRLMFPYKSLSLNFTFFCENWLFMDIWYYELMQLLVFESARFLLFILILLGLLTNEPSYDDNIEL